ncbi:hypothetical protein HK405_014866 [Cladochytrium tenue]|nr:hypothetical protein HK405_014866 [Cladochytrium tenue]
MARFYAAALARGQKSSYGGSTDPDIVIAFQPMKFDVTASTLTVLYTILQAKTDLVDAYGRIANATTFQVGGTTATKTFSAGQQVVPFQATYPIAADTSIYPFDSYGLNVTVFVTDVASGSLRPVVVYVYLDQPMQSFDYLDVPYYSYTDATDNILNVVGFDFSFRRSTLAIVLTLFSWLLMHMWALMIVFLAAQCIFRDRSAHPFMVWAAASIFSMATIRGIQPSAPTVGTYYDMGTYVWSVVVSCAAAFALFVASFRRHKPESEKDKLLKKKEKDFKLNKFLKDEAAAEAAAAAAGDIKPVPSAAAAPIPSVSNTYINPNFGPSAYQR